MGRSKSRPRRRRTTDGRRERSAHSRQLIIGAYLELLREGPRVPTTTEIAKRAGVSIRLVYERFGDLLGLSFAAADQVLAQAHAETLPSEVAGDRSARLRAQIATRARVCERWLPIWRALIHHQYGSPDLEGRMGRVYDLIVERLELMYRPELSTVPEPERGRLLIVLEALTDFESWGRMRERHGLSVEAAREIWAMAIDRILPPTPVDVDKAEVLETASG
jgi:AcrR family transcriptional regulator